MKNSPSVSMSRLNCYKGSLNQKINEDNDWWELLEFCHLLLYDLLSTVRLFSMAGVLCTKKKVKGNLNLSHQIQKGRHKLLYSADVSCLFGATKASSISCGPPQVMMKPVYLRCIRSG